MTLRLSVDRTAWDGHVEAVRASVAGLVPVVKGNGYGFGRDWLARRAASMSARVAVGTVWEVASVPVGTEAVVLSPALHLPDELARRADEVVLTVGTVAHVEALARHGYRGRVVIKVRSTMQRHGAGTREIAQLLAAMTSIAPAGLTLDGFALHLPLAGTDAERVAEIERCLGEIPGGAPLSVSHLAPHAFAALQRRHPARDLSLRLGTALWHGDRSALHLEADVVDRRPVEPGLPVGYRLAPWPGGELLLVGAGTAHGVCELPGGRSPFHFARRRLALHEPPHMHTSMVVSPPGLAAPEVGQWVDVQRPLTTIAADVVRWT